MGLKNVEVASIVSSLPKGRNCTMELMLDSGELDKQLELSTSVGGLIVSKTDYQAQEDALRINWTQTNGDYVRISTASPTSLARESNGAMELSFSAKSFSGMATIQVGQCDKNANCDAILPVKLDSDWYEFNVSLSCFDDLGVDMSAISSAFVIKSESMADIGIANIRLTSDIDARASCDGR